MKTKFRPRMMLMVVMVWLPSLGWAGRYPGSGTQTFTGAGPITNLGDGTVIGSSNTGTDGHPAAVVLNNALRLTQFGTGNTISSFKLPDLDAGRAVQAWEATMRVRMTATGTPADGWSLNVGPIPVGHGGGEGGFVITQGLTIAFDTYNNGGDPPSIEVFANGVSVGNFLQTFSFDATFRPLTIRWDENGLDIIYTVAGSPVAICTDLPTPGYVPAVGHTFAFSARTGGLTQDTMLDDLLITTTPLSPLETGGPVISEFVAANDDSLEDENGDASDWIEIYNGQAAAVNLSGWTLTDVPANRTLWTFPSVTVPGYGYLIVFASGKNRTQPGFPLHTNFALSRNSGHLALVRPGATVVASEFNYGFQADDISYGLLPNASSFVYGYLESPTPGARNTGLQAAGPPAEEVVFLRDGQPVKGGVFANAFTLSLQQPAAPGSVIRYTFNNTVPSGASPAYTSGLPINATTTVRARVFTPGFLPGPVSSRTFIRLDPSLTNYHGSGQPFSSNLPIVVLDSFGVPVDAYSDPGQPRPFRPTYAVVIDRDPLAASPLTNRSVITGPADFQGRGGTHVRGESSSGFPQKSYAWEIWNNADEDKNEPILGFPSESDWILHAPYTDKTLMRNYLAYDQMRALSGKAAAMGVKFVEVFFNQSGGSLSESDYRGVYVLVEKIKRDSERVAVEKLNSLMTDPAIISGGYIFKKDKPGIGNTTFSSSSFGQTFQFVHPDTPNNAQLTWLTNHVNAFESTLAGAGFAHPTTGYAAYIDPLSFINNQWFVEITKQIDGYRLSTYFYKSRHGKIVCAPIWDYNLSLYNADYATGDTHTGWYHSILGSGDYYYWARLHQDLNYRIRHWDRYWELRRGRFANDTILATIDGLATQLVNGSATAVTNNMPNQTPLAENPAMRHFRRWPILGTYVWPNPGNVGARTKFWNGPTLSPGAYTSSDAEVDAMKGFLRQRLNWIDDQNFVGTVIYRPPVFSLSGGSVPVGTTLTVARHTGTAPAGFSYASGGTLYYTLDGTDPRPPAGGTITASTYSSPLTLTTSAQVRARLFANSNWSPVTAANFIVGAQPASAANLVISELCYRPLTPAPGSPEFNAGFTEGNNFEFIELLNVSNHPVDLTNCQFTAGITFHFNTVAAEKLTLMPGARVLVVGHEAAFLLRYGSALAPQILGTFTGNLSNSGETVTLRAADTSIIASLTYGVTEPWPADASIAGYSMVLNSPRPNPAYQALSFRPSAQPGGTPGGGAGPPFAGNPTADTDNDGFLDLLEYAMGTSPTNPSSFSMPTTTWQAFTIVGVTNPYLTFSYRRNNAAEGVSWIVELSDALGNWLSHAAAVTYVGAVNNGDGTSTVTWRATQPTTNSTRQYIRLRTAQP